MTEDDWRLAGQERFLSGATLHWQAYRSPRPEWDHDHCEFCGAKFMEPPTDTLHAGYVSRDGTHWICRSCFSDFAERFRWRVEPPGISGTPLDQPPNER